MKVLFFASLKERLNCGELEISADDIATVSALREMLTQKGDIWAEALSSPKLLIAVNQEMSSLDTTITETDEIAFFPPVTGG